MKRWKSLTALVMAVFCVFALFAGCGNEPVGETESPSPSPSPSETVMAPHQTKFLSEMSMEDLVTYLTEAEVFTDEDEVKTVEETEAFAQVEVEVQQVTFYWFAAEPDEELAARYEELEADESVEQYGPFFADMADSPIYEELKAALEALVDTDKKPEESGNPNETDDVNETGDPSETDDINTSENPSESPSESVDPSPSDSPVPTPPASDELVVGDFAPYKVEEPNVDWDTRRVFRITHHGDLAAKGYKESTKVLYIKNNKPVYDIQITSFDTAARAAEIFSEYNPNGRGFFLWLANGNNVILHRSQTEISRDNGLAGITKIEQHISYWYPDAIEITELYAQK